MPTDGRFEDLGSFEDKDNIPDFVDFCVQVFKEFSGAVRLWCTINGVHMLWYAG
jgi:beta-glucosidase/6-phospho-beta-glucosidase/beta-galactosidase